MESAATARPAPSAADALMCRLLRLPAQPRRGGDGQAAFRTSILVSTVRCLLTYVALPLLKPAADLSGGVGPILGLILGSVSAVAIVVSMRRFWAVNHRMRWGYTAVGGAILLLLAGGAVADLVALLR